jgi:hypothetical protein
MSLYELLASFHEIDFETKRFKYLERNVANRKSTFFTNARIIITFIFSLSAIHLRVLCMNAVPSLWRSVPGPHPCGLGSSPSQIIGDLCWATALGQVFSEYFGFSCHSFIPLIASQSSPSIILGRYNRPIYGRSDSGLGSTTAHHKR